MKDVVSVLEGLGGGALRGREPEAVRQLFDQLVAARRDAFPLDGARLNAPNERGVYLIFDPLGNVAHVGRTPSGRKGLYQRLSDHLRGASSFVNIFLGGDASVLRSGYRFSYVAVDDWRLRALLEAYTIGTLCPVHLGRLPQSK